MISNSRLHVAGSLLRSNLSKLSIMTILEENHQTLDDLAGDLFDIFKNPITGEMYADCLFLDLVHMAEFCEAEICYASLMQELSDLIDDVKESIELTSTLSSRLVGVRLIAPETIILTYRSP